MPKLPRPALSFLQRFPLSIAKRPSVIGHSFSTPNFTSSFSKINFSTQPRNFNHPLTPFYQQVSERESVPSEEYKKIKSYRILLNVIERCSPIERLKLLTTLDFKNLSGTNSFELILKIMGKLVFDKKIIKDYLNWIYYEINKIPLEVGVRSDPLALKLSVGTDWNPFGPPPFQMPGQSPWTTKFTLDRGGSNGYSGKCGGERDLDYICSIYYEEWVQFIVMDLLNTLNLSEHSKNKKRADVLQLLSVIPAPSYKMVIDNFVTEKIFTDYFPKVRSLNALLSYPFSKEQILELLEIRRAILYPWRADFLSFFNFFMTLSKRFEFTEVELCKKVCYFTHGFFIANPNLSKIEYLKKIFSTGNNLLNKMVLNRLGEDTLKAAIKTPDDLKDILTVSDQSSFNDRIYELLGFGKVRNMCCLTTIEDCQWILSRFSKSIQDDLLCVDVIKKANETVPKILPAAHELSIDKPTKDYSLEHRF